MRKSEKIKYEVDPLNRLIYAKTSKESKVPKFRSVLDGTFRVDKKHALTYHIKKTQGPSIPRQLKLSGNWSLDKEHNLLLTLDKQNNQWAGNKLTLKGEIIDAKADELEFSISTKDSDGKTHLYMLRFGGRWQVDKYNRLSFLVTKEKGLYDELTFTGAWEVNPQNQIIYTYTKTSLKTKEKLYRTITFKGFWDITAKYRILYVLNKEINSCFDFKVSLGKPAKRGLQYEIGIGATPKKKTITLFGAWKINEKLGLLFEMPYAEGKVHRIVFGATGKLDRGYNLDLRLKNARHQDLGIDVKLSKTILKDQGQAFLEALKENKEISLVAGFGLRW